MCSRTVYKCQILRTDSTGYSKYHVILPPNFFRPEYYFMNYLNKAAIKKSYIENYLFEKYLLNLSKRVGYIIHIAE